jgi:hypothetical protein
MAEEQKALDPELTPIHVLSQAFKQDAAEDHRLAAMDLINQKAKEDKIADATTGTQWAPLVFSVLSRNYEGALEAWNGGRKTYSDAFGPDGTRYKQERNSRGSTGVILDAEGNPLDKEQLKEITKKGWVVSKEDMTAAGLGQFRATNEGILSMRKAPYEQVVGAYKKASDQATASSGVANQWSEMEKIAARSRNKDGVSWLDIYNKLPAAERAKLSAAASVQIQSATGANNESGTTAGLSGGNQATTSQQKGAEVSGNLSGKAPPAGAGGPGGVGGAVVPNFGAGVNASNSSSAAAQLGATTGATAGTSTSASAGVQQQAQFRNIVESIFQGKMSDSEFTDFQRFIQLNDSLNAIQEKRGGETLAPGSESLGKIDPLLSGQKNTAITAYKGMQNEALLSEWTHFLAEKMNSSGGRMPSQAELAKQFEDSETVKAIKYRYGSNIEQVRNGKAHEPKEGDVSVNNRNQLIVYRDGKWKDKK